MHEWALAEAVITAASEIAEKEGLKEVTEVRIKIGEIQQIERDIFNFALSQLKPAKFEKTRFTVETEKAELKCRVCGQEWLFNENKLDTDSAEAIHFVPEVAHSYIKCPKCGSPDFEIIRGRGVWLETVKGMK
ncbi:MAG: hydrogenase nickel incorporation protein HypA [Candidatus Bathyarchaeia archaeon]|jgi:hydrogenase nickel incorporation protein HypA/HybF